MYYKLLGCGDGIYTDTDDEDDLMFLKSRAAKCFKCARFTNCFHSKQYFEDYYKAYDDANKYCVSVGK